MTRFFTLLFLEIKKNLKLIPKLLVGSALLLFIVIAIGIGANKILSYDGDMSEDISTATVIDVGVVCYDDSWLMDLAKNIVGNLESIKTVLNLEFVDKSVAEKKLDSGDYMAVIIIPDNVIKDIMSGENPPITIEFPKNAGYEAAAIKEITEAAVRLLASVQASESSASAFYRQYTSNDNRREALNRLDALYIKDVLLREDFFNSTTVVSTGELEIEEYYMFSGMILFLFLFGMNYLAYRTEYRKEIIIGLSQNKVGYIRQILTRFGGMYALYLLVGCGFLARIFSMKKLEMSLKIELIGATALILAVVVAIMLLINVAINNKTAEIMLTFIISVVQGFAIGGLVPKLMLPETIQRIGEFTPAGFMFKELELVYKGAGGGTALNTVILVGILVLCLAGAAGIVKLRTKN